MQKDKKQKELEEKKLDEYWKDDDKKAQAKIQRKIEAENKRQQKLDRKKELRELYGEEEKALKSNKESKTTNSKVTQAQILQRLIEEKKKEIQEDKKKKVRETHKFEIVMSKYGIEAENKRQQKLDRKKELRELYGEEEKALKSNKESKTTNSKVTQAQILQRLIEEKKKEIQEDKKKKNNLNVHEMELEDNINHIMRDEINDYDEYINASGIDNVISALDNVSFEKTKKVKVAYKKFEEENLPLIKEQYKGLKLSQFKQILWKQFKKSPENPMNYRD
ncbi:hypothetical protein AK88_00721 [Plasmodium fragile]|uniref:Coiled-coil domain-containing protein n=1 Tax=Plasmodium fragile TaxID=5857 RepID=A0A0D9QQW7_PLAFR|nr:uncharacterized protein AK88_00721 [Plasmodium fragile]KJP89510.1 hypothetical protein AK88_00721 [Plasmodium fragile]